jgi:hypothetical protein
VLDGAAFGVYEDDDERGRRPLLVGTLVVLVVVVGLLVWRAADTDADSLDAGRALRSGTEPPPAERPTVDDVRALVPPGFGGCVEPESQPVDDPPRAALVCPRTGSPELVVFVLYASLADREAAFERVTDDYGVTRDSDCALGRNAVHDYIGVARVGRLACHSDGEVVDFVWTTDEAPLLVRARGEGSFADQYEVWNRIVERTDGRFPLPREQDLLEVLPDRDPQDCGRDLRANVDAGGEVAIVCAVDEGADLVTHVLFGSPDELDDWFDETRSDADSRNRGQGEQACSVPVTAPSEGSAPSDPGSGSPATSDTYDAGDRSGRVVCFTDADGEHTLAWTDESSSVGSVAVSGSAGRPGFEALLEWWAEAGRRT